MDFLPDILILFALAVAVVLLFHKLRLPSIIGFLVTGVIAGPHGLALISDMHRVEALAEIGVVLLLFTVGLEFSVTQLVRLRSFLVSAGALQVGLTVAAAAAVARMFGLSWPVAILGGMLLSLSSTAIVLRLLADEGELDAPASQAALGILVFQDLCIVPMMLVLPILGGETTGAGALVRDLVLSAAFIAAAFVVSRFALPRLLSVVVATRKREVFILTVFLFCLAAAWASSLIGLSLALGAFIAGLVVSESPYAHQALSEVLPLREVFNSLFFISIGMLFDVRFVASEPFLILGFVAAAIVLKIAITGGVTILVGQPPRIAIVAAFTLAQVGEFSFVLGDAGRQHGLLFAPWDQRFIAAAIGTMALTPLLIAAGPRAAALAERVLPARWIAGRSGPGVIAASGPPHEGHVIIVGYGLNGRNLARVLERERIPYVVVEMNPQTVRAERKRGRPIIYGDATSGEVLRHAGIARARVVVIAISDAAATRSAVAHIHRVAPRVHIVVRTRYVQEVKPLLALGTSEVVPEEFETAVELLARVLRRYDIDEREIEEVAREIRADGYELFRQPEQGKGETGNASV